MLSASTNLINYLNAQRVAPDASFLVANCYQITLINGVSLYLSDADYGIKFNGQTFLATGVQIQGLKSKRSVGLEVDRQQITIAATPQMLVNGAPILQMLRDGAFRNAALKRWIVFPNTPAGPDGALLFSGRFSTIDQVGRTYAKVTIASGLVILDYDMPRNLYSLTCNHTLYDSGCGLSASSFSTWGAVGAGSTTTRINFPGALAGHAQGKITFTYGPDSGVSATVKSVVAGTSLTLMYPLPEPPDAGDSFTVYYGCDHTEATCGSKFSNVANFRGFPFVPPPQQAY